MEMISLEGKSNFFEKRVSEYRMAHVRTDKDGLTSTIGDVHECTL